MDEFCMTFFFCSQCEMEGLKLTPLHVACEYGHEEITRILIEMGSANLSAKNKKRQTLLHKACEMDRVNILKILLRAGEKAYGRPKLGWISPVKKTFAWSQVE